MQPVNTTISLRKASPVACVLDIKGDVAATAEQSMLHAYTQATNAGARLIVLNFAQLAYMNSGGISLLITLMVQIKRQQQRLLAVGLNEFYRHLFALTRLDEVIRIYDTEDEALVAAGA
jgi:anti-sigma B factor antagonist